jgi:hypothetical protein
VEKCLKGWIKLNAEANKRLTTGEFHKWTLWNAFNVALEQLIEDANVGFFCLTF